MSEDVAQGEEPTFSSEGNRDFVDLFALLGGRDEVLAAVLDPLDRPAQMSRQPADERFFRIEAALGAEAAAHVRGRDHAHAVLGQVEQIGKHGADRVGRLGRVPHREGVERLVVARDDAAALHRVAAAAHHPEGLAQGVIGRREGALWLSDALNDVSGDVVAQLFVDERRAPRQRRRGRGDHRQHVVFDVNGVAGILGESARFRDDRRDHFAGVADLVAGQGVADAVTERGAGHRARHARGPRLLDVGDVFGGDDREHAGQRQRRRRVDQPHAGVSVRAAQHRRVDDAGDLEVVDECPAPREQARVLATRDRCADVAAFRRAHRRRGLDARRRNRSTRRRSPGRWVVELTTGDEREHRVDHALITRAAAEMARERVADLGLGESRIFPQRRGQRHENAARAEAALHAVVPDELGLQRVEP